MSDRVAIIGGSEVGRDHFPFPVEDAISGSYPDGFGDNSPRPHAIDNLAAMTKFFYVVKKWRFFMEFDFDIPEYETGEGTGHGFVQFDLIPKVRTSPEEFDLEDWTRESQVVQARSSSRCIFNLRTNGTVTVGISSGDEVPFTVSDPIGDSSSNSAAFDALDEDWLSGELYFDLFNTKYDGGAFYPWKALRYDTLSGTSNFASDGTGGGSEENGRFHLDQDTIIYSPLFAQLYGPPPPVGGEYVRVAGWSCNLGPIEFWPYASKADGSPIYDTSNGSQLQSPFN